MDQHILVSELQSLVTESKRRNPEVKDAGERALELLQGPFPVNFKEEQIDILLSPVTLGCKTKNAKSVGISISALQRLVALGGVPAASLSGVLQTLSSVANSAVDIQLKILQTLLSILTCCKEVHGDQLGDVLLLYFKLQDSRVSVVSSTAAATLRQAVMLIFNRIATDTAESSIPLTLPTDPPTEVNLTPSAIDAFNIFSDLCLLTSSSAGSSLSLWGSGEKEKPRLLRITSLQKTFGLELIESILSGYEEGVKQRPELLFLLRYSLDPLLLKLQGEKPTFPVALRVCRLIFLLIRSFTDQMPSEVETYLTSLIRMGMGDGDDEGKKDHVAPWLRVLSLEILRAICGDTSLLQKIWSHYDQSEGSHLFAKIVSALSRLVNEKPALLGIGAQMHGVGVPSEGNANAGYLDMGIGMVASAASAGVSTVSAMMGSGTGLGPQSAPKLRLIEQHDKAEPPLFPDTYIYLLALQSLDAVAEGIFHSVSQPPTHGMAESAWPALLAALSYCIGTNLSDNQFAEVLSALQNFTIACGLLELQTPRDAFLNTLGKYAVPPPVVSAMQAYSDQPSMTRNSSVISADALGLTALAGGPSAPPSLSERNLACLKSAVTTARILAGSLGDAWHDVLEALQNANYILSPRKPGMGRRPTTGPPASPARTRQPSESTEPRAEAFQDIDMESITMAINSLFDCSKDLDDVAFTTFVKALCQLSSEMIGMDSNNTIIVDLTSATPTTPTLPSSGFDASRRRTSGINISHNIKSTERSFGLSKLRVVSSLNLSRLVTRDADVGWSIITSHLLAVARHVTAPSAIRIDASDTLNDLLLGAIRVGHDSRVQHQVFDVLVRQVDVHPISGTLATDYDIRSAGYKTLNQILESSGHSLEVGWGTIFDMLNSVCKHEAAYKTQSDLPIGNGRPVVSYSKGDANLVRIAFPSLTLICTDFLTSLDANAMRQCIACLGCFGRQREDVNITLAAVGLLWNVSDAVQGDSKDLWLYLLTELLDLGRDTRLEVRSSAMQTLFRCVELYGTNLSSELWEDVFWKVIFPLLDSAPGDESQVLALSSVGGIFGTFLHRLCELPTFERIYQHLLDGLKRTFLNDPRQCCTAALKALERVLQAVDASKAQTVNLDTTWDSFVEMGEGLSIGEPYTQENLLALVRVASLLHTLLRWTDERLRMLCSILRNTMTYSRSTEYRPDVDTLSPLQSAIVELVTSSKTLPPSLILSDLAEFSSLAYVGDTSSKVSYVALAKYAMPKMAQVFQRCAERVELYNDGTVESVLGAYSIPIKLRYDCPAPNRFGDDPPLWKTAMNTLGGVLKQVVKTLNSEDITSDRFEGIWSQIMDVFSGMLLAENSGTSDEDEQFVLPILESIKTSLLPCLVNPRVPDQIIVSFSEILRKASILYHYDVRHAGGTTAGIVPNSQEGLSYWAWEVLIGCVDRTREEHGKKVNGGEIRKDEQRVRVAKLVLPSAIRRFEDALRCFVDDAKLRGQMPFPRVREDELLYILRHLAMMQLWEGTMITTKPVPEALSTAYKTSTRAHLFHFYPLLLELSFLKSHLPSLYLFPSEHSRLFGLTDVRSPLLEKDAVDQVNGDGEADKEVMDAGDGGDLIEVNARLIARRCLELLGTEMGLS